MPSGFVIFRYDGTKLLLPDACQNIWADFVDDSVAKDVISFIDLVTLEDKDSAISEDTGVSEALAKMIMHHRQPKEKLAVGNQDYKKLIESNMDIECLCCPAVEELMWGLNFLMGNFVSAKRSGLTNEDYLPMSQGMQSFLNSHGFDIKPDIMVTKRTIQMAGRLNECDQCVNKYKYFLLDAADHIMEISHIDTKGWDLLKIATALVRICCPEEKIAAPQWLFPSEQLKILRKHAPRYEIKISKMPLMIAYNEMYWARILRFKLARRLQRLIKHDRKACEAELASDHGIGMINHQQQMAPPRRGSVNGFPNPKLDREGNGRHDNRTNLVRSSSGGLGGAENGINLEHASHSTDSLIHVLTQFIEHHVDVHVKNGSKISGIFHAINSDEDSGVVLKMVQVIKDGSVGGQRCAADVVNEHDTVIIPAREVVRVFIKDEESSSYIFDGIDPYANIQTNDVSQPASDDSSNKPFSVVDIRFETLSKDGIENLGKRKVQPENNLSGGGRPLVSEGLDGPPAAPETSDSTVYVKHASAVEPVTSYQTPGSSASECIAENSFASASGLSPSTPLGSLASKKSTMNPNAKEFKLNPNAKSFTPSASLMRLHPPALHPPASETSYYYANNVLAAALESGLQVGMGFPPAGGQPVMYSTWNTTGYMHCAGPQYWQQQMMG
ncbi:unnamed protein product [Urochloa humidicola]